MAEQRYTVIGLARARSQWFGDLARWSTAGLAPIDFVKCVSSDEVRARIATNRRFSALVVDAGASGLDRDLVATARDAGCAAFVVDDGHTGRNWAEVGVAAVLAPPLDRRQLLDALAAHARPVGEIEAGAVAPRSARVHDWRARLVGVCGVAGSGSSTVAMAAAQGLARSPGNRGQVALADLCLDADLALYHDTHDVVPGLPELVEAHRSGHPVPSDVRSLCIAAPDRGYDLLMGLRRHRDWVALRPRAVEAAIDGLRRSYRLVVTDTDADVEGELDTGSIDVEERNVLARTALGTAEVVVVVGGTGIRQLRGILRIAHRLIDLGVPAERIVPVVNRAPRSPRARAEVSAAFSALAGGGQGWALASPLFLPERRQVEAAHRDAVTLPSALATPLATAVGAVLQRHPSSGLEERVATPAGAHLPMPVAPGSLGHLTGGADADADSDTDEGAW